MANDARTNSHFSRYLVLSLIVAGIVGEIVTSMKGVICVSKGELVRYANQLLMILLHAHAAARCHLDYRIHAYIANWYQ